MIQKNKIGPFIKDENSTGRMMNRVIFALIPIILFTFIKNGLLPFLNGNKSIVVLIYPLIFITLSTLTSLFTEVVYYRLIKKKRGSDLIKTIKNSFSILPGLFLSLVVSINTPIIVLVLAAIIASLSKLIFGGFGKNKLNPALVGALTITLLTLFGIIALNGGYLNKHEIDTKVGATPLSNITSVKLEEKPFTYDNNILQYGGIISLLIGFIPGTLGEISAILIIFAFIYLTATKTIKWKIPVFYIGTVFLITLAGALMSGITLWYPLFNIITGGLLFGAVFMTTDPVTTPTTSSGQIIFGISLGLLTLFIRNFTFFPEGVMISILIMNLFTGLIDRLVINLKNSKLKKVLPYIMLIIIAIPITYFIGKNETIKEKLIDKPTGFQIIEKVIGAETKYIVTQKSFGGNIKLQIIIKDNKIISIEVIEQNDSYFTQIEDNKLIEKIIKEQDKLDNIDTVSGATISSNALKNAVKNTLNDFLNNSEAVTPTQEKPTLEKEQEGETTIYTITEKSFGGDILVKVYITNNKIDKLEIKEQNDSFFKMIEEANYLNKFIDKDSVDELDAVSGATISSNAIKKAAKRALTDYNN